MITFHHVSYTYPHRTAPALGDVSLVIQPGEFVLVSGESGSGKSTLLRAINGLVPHFTGGRITGQVVVNGLDTVKVGPQRLSRHVGFVWQNPEAQAVLDRVEPEIAFGMENAAIPRPEMLARMPRCWPGWNLPPCGIVPLKRFPVVNGKGWRLLRHWPCGRTSSSLMNPPAS